MSRVGSLSVIFVFTCIILFTSSDRGKPKSVLLWTSLAKPLPNWHLPSNVGDHRYFEQLHCPATNCVITSNKTYLPRIQDYDVIAMNSWNIPAAVFPPAEERDPGQIYLVYFHESPSRTKASLSNYSTHFNWTMSYQLNADVVIPYAQIYDLETGEVVAPSQHKPNWRHVHYQSVATQDESVRDLVENKSKMAAWFVSSCFSPSQRKFVVKKLQEFIPVDVYGKCGTLTCGKNSRTFCREMVERDYKFYLSFENSLCTDYVTEKVFQMMAYNVIPVVFGGADYERFLPPGSYINVLDYESVEDLAKYLQYVANDTDEYMKYFWWKRYYGVRVALNFCPLCQKLWQVQTKTQYYNDLDYWFKNGTCIAAEDVPLVRKVLLQYHRIKKTNRKNY